MARYQFFQTALRESKEIQDYLKGLAKVFTKIVKLRTDLAGYSYTKHLLNRHEAQCFHFLTHMFNCTFSTYGYERDYVIPIPLDSSKTKSTFDLLFHTKDTKQSYLKKGQKGLMSLKDSKVLDEYFDWEIGNNLTHICSLFKFNRDIFDDLLHLVIHSDNNYKKQFNDLICDCLARNTLNKPNIEISQIHNARFKNPSAQLYKQRVKSQEVLILDIGNATKFLHTFLPTLPKIKRAILISDYKSFLVKCLEKGRIISGTTLNDLKLEIFLTHFVDKYGRMYDDFGWVNLKSQLKDALTPDYINIDLKSCYININSQLFKNNNQYCSYYKVDERKYLYKILNLNKTISFDDVKPLLKTTNLRFQFSSSPLNHESELMDKIEEFPVLNNETFKNFFINTINENHRFKSLRRNQKKYWSKIINNAKNNVIVNPRGLPFDLSDFSTVEKYKKAAVHTLQGIEANLIDVTILGLNQDILDTILGLPKRTPLSVVEEILDKLKQLPWSTIEHDGYRVHKKHYKSIMNTVSINNVTLELEYKNQIQTQDKDSKNLDSTNTNINNTNTNKHQTIILDPRIVTNIS